MTLRKPNIVSKLLLDVNKTKEITSEQSEPASAYNSPEKYSGNSATDSIVMVGFAVPKVLTS